MFFNVPEFTLLDKFSSAATSSLKNIQEEAQSKLVMVERKKIEIQISAESPKIIIAENFEENSPVFILDLGHFKFFSDNQTNLDIYKLKILNIKAFLCENEDWNSLNNVKLLEDIDFDFTFKMPKNFEKNQYQVYFEMPAPIQLHFSVGRFRRLLKTIKKSVDQIFPEKKSTQVVSLNNESYQSITGFREILFNMKIPSIKINLYNESESDLLQISFLNFNLDLISNSVGEKIEMVLKAFRVTDKKQKWGEEFQDLVQFGQSDQAITIKIENASERKNNEAKVKANLETSDLKLLINRETLIELGQIIGQLSSQKQEKIDTGISIVIEKPKIKKNAFQLLNLCLKLGSLGVTLNREGNKLFTFYVGNSDSLLKLDNCGDLEVNGNIGSMSVVHLLTNGPHKEFMTTMGENSFSFNLKYYNKMSTSFPGHSLNLKLKMSKIKSVFLNLFTDEIVSYFDEMNDMKNYFAKSAGNVMNQIQENNMAKISIEIVSPLIVVPKHSTSQQVLFFTLGDTKIEIVDTKSGNSLIHSVDVLFKNLQASSGKYNEQENSKNIIQKTKGDISNFDFNLTKN